MILELGVRGVFGEGVCRRIEVVLNDVMASEKVMAAVRLRHG